MKLYLLESDEILKNIFDPTRGGAYSRSGHSSFFQANKNYADGGKDERAVEGSHGMPSLASIHVSKGLHANTADPRKREYLQGETDSTPPKGRTDKDAPLGSDDIENPKTPRERGTGVVTQRSIKGGVQV